LRANVGYRYCICFIKPVPEIIGLFTSAHILTFISSNKSMSD
jgi:hypothetical protein